MIKQKYKFFLFFSVALPSLSKNFTAKPTTHSCICNCLYVLTFKLLLTLGTVTLDQSKAGKLILPISEERYSKVYKNTFSNLTVSTFKSIFDTGAQCKVHTHYTHSTHTQYTQHTHTVHTHYTHTYVQRMSACCPTDYRRLP